MLVDSHCHINFPELAQDAAGVLARMRANDVTHALCVSVNLPEWPSVIAMAEAHEVVFASVGVHPDYEHEQEPSVEDLVQLAQHPKVIAIGETGLDYFRLKGDLEWQRERFRTHIRAAVAAGLPLIIHTRAAAADTLRIMREENAASVGGVMHCFTESWEVAREAMAMNFYISFSGIVTFKNARDLKEVASRVPLDRLLVETDSPYLAPVPYRGKTNEPAYVLHVAEEIARLKKASLETVKEMTGQNFFTLFRKASRPPA